MLHSLTSLTRDSCPHCGLVTNESTRDHVNYKQTITTPTGFIISGEYSCSRCGTMMPTVEYISATVQGGQKCPSCGKIETLQFGRNSKVSQVSHGNFKFDVLLECRTRKCRYYRNARSLGSKTGRALNSISHIELSLRGFKLQRNPKEQDNPALL